MKRSIALSALPALAVVMMIMVALPGCPSKEEKSVQPKIEETKKEPRAAKVVKKPEAPEPLNVKISAPGAPKKMPGSVVIQFSRPISPDKKTAEEEIFKITPPVGGKLHLDKNAFTFIPEKSFAFDTAYSVELLQINTEDGVLRPPSPGEWSARFETPPFVLRKAV